MHEDHAVFIKGINEKQKVILTFRSKQDGGTRQVRLCAPMDYGPRAQAQDKRDCYHFHDYGSAEGPHTLSLPAEQVISIGGADETFDPAEFVTWDPNWHYQRNWGGCS